MAKSCQPMSYYSHRAMMGLLEVQGAQTRMVKLNVLSRPARWMERRLWRSESPQKECSLNKLKKVNIHFLEESSSVIFLIQTSMNSEDSFIWAQRRAHADHFLWVQTSFYWKVRSWWIPTGLLVASSIQVLILNWCKTKTLADSSSQTLRKRATKQWWRCSASMCWSVPCRQSSPRTGMLNTESELSICSHMSKRRAPWPASSWPSSEASAWTAPSSQFLYLLPSNLLRWLRHGFLPLTWRCALLKKMANCSLAR